MAVKTLCVHLNLVDSDTVCTIYNQLYKLPCLFKYDAKKNELLITAQPHILALAEKVVAKYV